MKRPLHSPLDVDAAADLTRQRRAVLVLLGLAILHAWLIWGYTGVIWGDHGRWLHEVTRFAAGQTPYRDFDYRNPPLALALVGGLARIFGTSLAAISAITTALFLAVIATFAIHLRRSMPDLILPVGIPALLFAFAYCMRNGVPLPLGTESTTLVVGFLFLQLTVVFSLATADQPQRLSFPIGAGACAAITLTSRHEFGAAALFVIGAAAVLLWRPNSRPIIAAAVALAVALFIGFIVAVSESGLRPVVYMVSGSGRNIQVLASAIPSLERITVEVAASSAVIIAGVIAMWLCLAIDDRTAARSTFGLGLVFLAAAATHLGMSVSIGSDLLRSGPDPLPTLTQDALWRSMAAGHGLASAAIGFLDRRIQAHLFPAILPPILLATMLLRWHAWRDISLRNRVTMLLGLCVVMRLREGFAGAEWYNVLIELPTVIMFLRLASSVDPHKAGRAVRALMAIFILLGVYAYASLGRGPLTFVGPLAASTTPVGRVHWSQRMTSEFHRVDSLTLGLDRSRVRPVFAFGAGGGWNYFLARLNPTPITEGISGTPFRVDSINRALRRIQPPPILIDNQYAQWPAVSPSSSVLQWEPEPEPSPTGRLDRARFERIKTGCTAVGAPDPTQLILVLDCAGRPPVLEVAPPVPAVPPDSTPVRRPGSSP